VGEDNMKKIFISQDMRQLSQEEILKVRLTIMRDFKNLFGTEFEFIDSYKPDLQHKSPIEALGHSLVMLSGADILLASKSRYESVINFSVGYCNDHKMLRGVETEINVAATYGIPVIFYSLNEQKDQVRFEFNIK
jgi:hypothetical protein